MDPSYYNNPGNFNLPPIGEEIPAFVLPLLGGLLLFFLIIFILFYIFSAICLQKIAKKTQTENAWFAWVPILNLLLMLNIAKKPTWWIILFFIPLANIVFTILVWMEISKKLGKPEWLGFLIIIPLANLIVPAYLAFSKDAALTGQTTSEPPTQTP